MPGPAYPTFAKAFTRVLEQAKLSRSELARQLRQRDVKADQSLVSKWCNGHLVPAHITHYPIIEEIARVPRGTIFKLAGYVEEWDDTVEQAINTAAELDEPARRSLLDYYLFLTEQDDPEEPIPNPRSAAEMEIWEQDELAEAERTEDILSLRRRARSRTHQPHVEPQAQPT